MPPRKRIHAVLLDVGGTLWPEGFPPIADRGANLTARLCEAVSSLSPDLAASLLSAFDRRAERLHPELTQDTDALVRECAVDLGITLSIAESTSARRAMCLPVRGNAELFPGARELLAGIKGHQMRAVVVSNAVSRDSDAYTQDFVDFGVGHCLDGVISSVDVGFRKPHPRMFEAALAIAGCAPRQCVMVGNTEDKDIVPAAGLGMRTVLVCIEDAPPPASAADAVVTSLFDVLPILESWRS